MQSIVQVDIQVISRDERTEKSSKSGVTPLWKRKSISRKSSSFKSPRAAIMKMNQMSSQEDRQSQAVKFAKPAETISSMPIVSHTPVEASPGLKFPVNVSIVTNPY